MLMCQYLKKVLYSVSSDSVNCIQNSEIVPIFNGYSLFLGFKVGRLKCKWRKKTIFFKWFDERIDRHDL